MTVGKHAQLLALDEGLKSDGRLTHSSVAFSTKGKGTFFILYCFCGSALISLGSHSLHESITSFLLINSERNQT